MTKSGYKRVCENRKAYFNYEIEQKLEAGIELVGTEVKALREGKANLSDSYAEIIDGEVILISSYIGHYTAGNRQNHDTRRPRKLLLHKQEINKLTGKVKERGRTLIPLQIYFNSKGIAKVELAVAKGKHSVDKRKTIMERDLKREAEREMKER